MKRLFILSMMIGWQLMANAIVWSTPTTISTPEVDATNVVVGVDSSGDVFAIWLENGYVQFNSCASSGSWGTTTTLSNANASSPSLAVDSSGNATAIWVENDSVITAQLPFGQSWSSPVTLAVSGGSCPSIVCDPSGNIAAIWVQNGSIYSSVCLLAQSWTTPSVISLSGTTPQIAISQSGAIIAVWHAVNAVSSMDTIYSSTSSIFNATWSAAQAISNPSQNSVKPKVAIDSDGNATTLWFSFEKDGSRYTNVYVQAATLIANQYSWSTPTNLSDAGVTNPSQLFNQVMYTNSGAVIAAWVNSYDGINYNIETTSLIPGKKWSFSIIRAQDPQIYSGSLALSPVGNAFLAYMSSNSGTMGIDLFCKEVIVGGLGSDAQVGSQVVSSNTFNGFPSVAVSNSTETTSGVIGWISHDGNNKIVQVATGSSSLLQPPTGLEVTQSSTDYKVVTEHSNTITWEPSATDTSVGSYVYLIYRNGILLTTLGSDTFQYTDMNRLVGTTDTYGVALFNDYTGEESSLATITYSSAP